MRNVSRRDISPGDTAWGIVYMKVLLKLVGLIGSCHRREPREMGWTKGWDGPQASQERSSSGKRDAVPRLLRMKLIKGHWMLVLNHIILCFLNFILFSAIKVFYIFFLVYQPAEMFLKTQHNKQKSSVFLYFYSPCHSLTIVLHWIFPFSQFESSAYNLIFYLSFTDLCISTMVIK